jgi:para-aminobenzoate synthetase/4-amino-4-deoxychorismate lyase
MEVAANPNPLKGLTPPFVLLENRLDLTAPARLFRRPTEIVQCDHAADVAAAFARIEAGLARGLHAAGTLAYDLGHALEPKLARLMPQTREFPLLWFGLFETAQAVTPRDLDRAFAERGPPPPITDLTPGHDRAEHIAKVRRILELIGAGDVYQTNLTFPMRFRHAGDPLALYAALRAALPVAHGGMVVTDDWAVLSVSPELWIAVEGGAATARPMKGTAARGADPAADRAAAEALAADPKQRAENLMIVDLLRNDLSRISRPGAVRTPALFTVETYPGFHTLTSTVTGALRSEAGLLQRVSALFPCGSIVGAPKVRAAEVIRDLEAEPRGVYTGALGSVEPGGDMAFNVAIRTAFVRPDGTGVYGVGGGIVADSDPDAEYDEALLKARVLTDLAVDFGLIETLRWTAAEGFRRIERHLERLSRSARTLGFRFDRLAAERALERRAVAWRDGGDRRVRIVLSRNGVIEITQQAVAPPLAHALRVAVARQRLDAGDPILRHKTTRRETYETAFAEAERLGFDEALLLNRYGAVADASRNTVFAEIDGRLVTPPLGAGALAGVLRAEMLDEGRAVEGDLTLADIAGAERWFLGNSLHGPRRATLGPIHGGIARDPATADQAGAATWIVL